MESKEGVFYKLLVINFATILCLKNFARNVKKLGEFCNHEFTTAEDDTAPWTVQVYVHNSYEATQSAALKVNHFVVACTSKSETESLGREVLYCKKTRLFKAVILLSVTFHLSITNTIQIYPSITNIIQSPTIKHNARTHWL